MFWYNKIIHYKIIKSRCIYRKLSLEFLMSLVCAQLFMTYDTDLVLETQDIIWVTITEIIQH